MLKMILGILTGVAGMVLLGSIVVEAPYLAWAADDFAVKLVLAFAGLAMVHLGYRLVSAPRPGKGQKRPGA